MLNTVGRVLHGILSLSPDMAALACAAFGIAAVMASFILNIAVFDVTWSGDPLHLVAAGGESSKQVGFFWALNWSLVFVLLMPLTIYFALEAYQGMPDILAKLTERRMIVTKDWQPLTAEALEAHWQGIWRGMSPFVLIVVALGIGLVCWDFSTVVGAHYADPSGLIRLSITDKALEVDWSVAAPLCKALGRDCHIVQWTNYWFALVLYVLLAGLGGIFAMGFFVFVVGVTRLMQPSFLRRQGLRLVPALGTEDRRRGFEIFEPLFEGIIGVTFLTFAMGYLMSLQNIYLRDPSPFILSFVFPDIERFTHALASSEFGKGVDALVGVLFTDRKTENVTTAIAVLFGLFIMLTIAMSLFISLRRAARAARAELRAALIGGVPLPAMLAAVGDRDLQVRRLDAMDIWPVAWLDLNRLALWLVVAMLCLIFYKIGLFLIALGLIVLGRRAWSAVKN